MPVSSPPRPPRPETWSHLRTPRNNTRCTQRTKRPHPTHRTPHRAGRHPRPRLTDRLPALLPSRLASRLTPTARDDLAVLAVYLLTRALLWATAYCATHLFPRDPRTRRAASTLSAWEQWDWWHYLRIAQEGYFPDGRGPWSEEWDNREAFFPGFPLALRAVHTVVPDWAAAGLLVSFVSGAVAVLALARIARERLPGVTGTGRRAVLYFLLSPCAVFLAAGYTEALFLAFALPAWLAARHRAWPRAALLACLATTVRVSGLFLAAALLTHFLTTVRVHRDGRALPWLALPALPLLAHTCYLYVHTGDWMAWKHAEQRGWYRDFHDPRETWSNTWDAAFGHTVGTGYALEFQAELLAMVLGLLLTAFLLYRRHWPEAVYTGLTLCALGTSYWYMSLPRATLLWWPVWTLLAVWTHRTPRAHTPYLCLTIPLTTLCALTFLTGRWAG
ncbi:mannosyltransferase family protein [Streptomyces sp. G45]|uniref:mannosyltransferase family protein n=1 Tax=Streptomyces sp. G45 TaxID=3406627 RepID=UPI003C295A7C